MGRFYTDDADPQAAALRRPSELAGGARPQSQRRTAAMPVMMSAVLSPTLSPAFFSVSQPRKARLLLWAPEGT